MTTRAPRFQYSKRAATFVRLDGQMQAAVIEDRDRELEDYLSRLDDDLSGVTSHPVGRGLVRFATKPSSQSVAAGAETPITGLTVQGPASAGRATRINYALRIASVTTQPAVATQMTVLLRLNTTTGPVMERHSFPWAPGQVSADPSGWSILGTTRAYPLTASQTVVLDLYLGSSLALVIGDSSFMEATDCGVWPPP